MEKRVAGAMCDRLLGLEPPLTLVCSDFHLEMEGYPIEQGAVIEIPLLPPGHRRP